MILLKYRNLKKGHMQSNSKKLAKMN
jgi:hypothetical protein